MSNSNSSRDVDRLRQLVPYQRHDTAQPEPEWETIRDLCREYGFPPTGISPIWDKQRKRYIYYLNHQGLTWLVQNDDRGVLCIESVIEIDAMQSKGYARVKATVRFRDGSYFSGHGSCTVERPGMTVSTINAIAETRAKVRAMRSATASVLVAHPEIDNSEIDTTTTVDVVEGITTEMKLSETGMHTPKDVDALKASDLAGKRLVLTGYHTVNTSDGRQSDIWHANRDGDEYDYVELWAPNAKLQAFFREFLAKHPGEELDVRLVQNMTESGRFSWSLQDPDDETPTEIPF